MQMDVNARKEILEEFRYRMARRRIFWTTVSLGGASVVSSFTAGNETVVFEDDNQTQFIDREPVYRDNRREGPQRNQIDRDIGKGKSIDYLRKRNLRNIDIGDKKNN